MDLEGYLRAVPKAELHVHLEGSIRPETVLELAGRNDVPLPYSTSDDLKGWFAFRDFDHFIEVYVAITKCLRTVDDYELIVADLASELNRQNCRYAEVTFSPSTHRWLGVGEDTMFEGLRRGRARAAEEFGVEINWVFDIVRNMSEDMREPLADFTTSAAIAGRDEGVVALGLGGFESGYPPELFEKWFARAQKAGLRSAPHAGEHSGPESVWGALSSLGAERLGHGIRSVEDASLVAHLARQGIPIEACPTSNLRLGVYPSLEAHPLRRLHEEGVVVTVNSDDPPLFNTTLNDEVSLLSTGFGFDLETIDEILLNAVRMSFLPETRKAELESGFRAEMAALKAPPTPP